MQRIGRKWNRRVGFCQTIVYLTKGGNKQSFPATTNRTGTALTPLGFVFPQRVCDHHLGRCQNLFQSREEIQRWCRWREVGYPVPDGPVLHLPSPPRCMLSSFGMPCGRDGEEGLLLEILLDSLTLQSHLFAHSLHLTFFLQPFYLPTVYLSLFLNYIS